MRRTKLSIAQLLAVAPIVAFFGFAARADGPSSWDDRHMQSNFTHFLDPAGPRPPILGVDSDGKIAHDAAPVATGVQERTFKISQHAWQPGGPRPGGPSERPANFSSSGSAWDARATGRSTGARGGDGSAGGRSGF